MKSMTAFGSAQLDNGPYSYSCEIKSLNSRFIEVNCRGPRFLMSMEPQIIKEVKQTLARGKVEIFFEIKSQQKSTELPELNLMALDHYQGLFRKAHAKLKQQLTDSESIPDLNYRVQDFIRFDQVLTSESGTFNFEKSELHREAVFDCLNQALQMLVEHREQEGKGLKVALIEMVSALNIYKNEVDSLRERIQAKIESQFKEKILGLVKNHEPELGEHSPVNDRIATEIAIATDKADIEEEVVRLGAHIERFEIDCQSDQPVGRKLDFLCQELHREVNTTSSKLIQVDASELSLKMKQVVERLRQQVQNVE